MYSTNRRAALIAILVGVVMLLTLSACGRPDLPSAGTGAAPTISTGIATPTDDTTEPTVAPDATAAPGDTDPTAGVDATAAPTDAANATPTPASVDDTDPFTGTDQLPDTDELSGTDDLSGTIGMTPTTQLTVTHPVAIAIANYFDLTPEQVIALHQDGLGFGEIARAYFLAQELAADGDPSNDMTAEQILALHQSGQGWGNIVAQLGLPRGNSQRNLGQIMSGRKQRNDAGEDDSGATTGATNTTGVDKPGQEHGPPVVPPGQQKDKGKDQPKPHQNNGNGGNGNGHGNGGGNGGGKKK